ncbi:YjbE family putative metal transport protein [Lichenicola cladoniae]|uniref:YjbE family putative metal transport protein n=1 Tax=Lichenicola cladoniae TaxID=1484109 RepID=A0A6M8HM45_9PROT|nr:YjbE family putative metal transport protein [Lichenicola cladoniae]NPD66865.1 YjbE family putative metal transport protein [Acetobacteraceae bacterium]QKE89425.1 YjbE family putative metal transport protein [Lichenicola cladoniae]
MPIPHHLLPQLLDLLQVLVIDVTLAGDNAVVVGLAVMGLPPRQRKRAMLFGIAAATVIRIALATVAMKLLAIVGLMLAGGLLLLWVCWRMYRELRSQIRAGHDPAAVERIVPGAMRRAIVRIVLADLSMSLDNVLAVAGAAGQHVWVLVTGLAVSVLLMGAAATIVAKLLERYRWIAWIGLLIVLGVSVELIFKGSHEVLNHMT